MSFRPSFFRSTPFILALGLVTACADDPTGTNPPNTQQGLQDSLVLAPGQETFVRTLRLSFLSVSADSRCPIDATCIWQGNAAVEIALGVGMGPSHPVTLNTSEGRPTAVFAGYRVTLAALLPAPRSDRQIAPKDYRASFVVTGDE